MPLGVRVKRLGKERGWYQAALGEKVGADSQRMSHYEYGRLAPSLAAAVRRAEALYVTVAVLQIIDGLIAKSRLKTLAGGIS